MPFQQRRINIAAFIEPVCILLIWALCFATSLKNMGTIPGYIVLLLNAVLVFKNPINGIVIIVMLNFVPFATLKIPHLIKISFLFTFVASMLRMKHLRIIQIFNFQILFILFFLIVLLISTLIGLENKHIFRYALNYMEGAVLLCLAYALTTTPEKFIWLLKWWCILAALSIFVGAAHYYFGEKSYLYQLSEAMGILRERKLFVEIHKNEYVGRLLWFGKGPNGHAFNLMFPLGLGLVFSIVTKRIKQKIFWVIMVCLIACAMLGTYSRSGMISMSLLILMFITLNRKTFVPLTILLGVVITILLILIPTLSDRILGINTALDSGASGRFYLWGEAIRFWFQSPIWGHGLASYLERVGHAAHNSYLQILAESGVIGLFFYLSIIGFAILKALRCRNVKVLNISFQLIAKGLIISLLGSCIMMMTITIEEIKLFWLQCGLVSLTFSMSHSAMRQTERQSSP